MISREAWAREADSLDAKLSRLLKQLINGQITPLEYAKVVLRLHGTEREEESLFIKKPGGVLALSPQWLAANQDLVKEYLKVSDDISRMSVGRRRGTPEQAAPYYREFVRLLHQNPSLPNVGSYEDLLPTEDDWSLSHAIYQVQRALDNLRRVIGHPLLVNLPLVALVPTEGEAEKFVEKISPQSEEEWIAAFKASIPYLSELRDAMEQARLWRIP